MYFVLILAQSTKGEAKIEQIGVCLNHPECMLFALILCNYTLYLDSNSKWCRLSHLLKPQQAAIDASYLKVLQPCEFLRLFAARVQEEASCLPALGKHHCYS